MPATTTSKMRQVFLKQLLHSVSLQHIATLLHRFALCLVGQPAFKGDKRPRVDCRTSAACKPDTRSALSRFLWVNRARIAFGRLSRGEIGSDSINLIAAHAGTTCASARFDLNSDGNSADAAGPSTRRPWGDNLTSTTAPLKPIAGRPFLIEEGLTGGGIRQRMNAKDMIRPQPGEQQHDP